MCKKQEKYKRRTENKSRAGAKNLGNGNQAKESRDSTEPSLKPWVLWSYQFFMVTWFIFCVAVRCENELPIRVHGQEAQNVLFLALYKAGDGFCLRFRHGACPTERFIVAVFRCANTWNTQETADKAP